MRRRIVLAGLIATLVAACAANPDSATSTGSTGPPATTTTTLGGRSPYVAPDPRLTSFDGARVDDDGRALVVSLYGFADGAGPCTATYSGEVTESSAEVVVQLRAALGGADGNTTVVCAAIGYARTVRLPLAAPLGDRRVIDASSATEVGVLRVAFPEPGWLPDGWVAGVGSGRSGNWSVSYGRGDGARHLTVTVGPADPSPIPPDSTVTGDATVQGRGARWILPGSVGYDQLVVADDGYSVVLAPYGLDRPTVEWVAESLQPFPIA